MASFTKSELMQKLRELHGLGLSDPEMAHSEADNSLVRCINDPEVTASMANSKVLTPPRHAEKTGICGLSCLSVSQCK